MKILSVGAETRKSLCREITAVAGLNARRSKIVSGLLRRRECCAGITRRERNSEKGAAEKRPDRACSGFAALQGKRGAVAVVDFADEKRKRRKMFL